MHELQCRSIRLHTKHAGTKPLLLTAYCATVGGVAHRAPDPVVEAITQVRWSRMGITGAPPGIKNLAHVSFIIPVRILQEQKVWNVCHDDSPTGEGQRCGNIQAVSKDCHLVALPISIGIFKDLDFIVSDPVRSHLVGIVDGFCSPKAPPFVPGKTNRVDDIRLTGKELQSEAHRGLSVFHTLFRR